MHYLNPLQLNDWSKNQFLYAVIAIQLAILGLATLSASGMEIPFLRYVVGFIYLTFIPGIILLRILRLHALGTVRTLLYAVGLSLAFNMLLGFVINLLYPYLGITKPISTIPIFITWAVVMGLLCLVSHIRDRDFTVPVKFELRNLFSVPIMLFALLPIMAILGTTLVNSYNNNIVLMLLIAVISIIPIFLIITKVIPENYYPLIVWMVSIAILFHTALISSYICGWDVQTEYYMYKVVVERNLWNSIVPLHQYNGVLSVTILPAIYGFILNLDGVWIFKILFPLFFSLVPLALFQIFQKQFGGKVAFLSIFYFVAVTPFFTVMLELGKQMIAEVFFAFTLLALLDNKLDRVVKSFFIIVFGMCVVVSHYSTSYLFMLVLLGAFLLMYVIRKKSSPITITLSILFIVLSLAWYLYGSGGVSFQSLTSWGNTVYSGLGDFLNPLSRFSYYMIAKERLPLHDILLYLYLVSQICIVIGFSVLFVDWTRKNDRSISNEYMALSAMFFVFMALSAVLPRLAGVTDLTRSFLFSLFLLAPFSVLGSEIIIQLAQSVFTRLRKHSIHQSIMLLNYNHNALLVAFALFVLPFFLFTTGFIYEILGDPETYSIALSRDKTTLAVFSRFDIKGATWILDSRGVGRVIYCDPFGRQLFASYIGPSYITTTENFNTDSPDKPEITSKVPANSYVYFREYNVKTGKVSIFFSPRDTKWYRDGVVGSVILSSMAFNHTIEESDIIYTNGGSFIYNTRSDYIIPSNLWGPAQFINN